MNRRLFIKLSASSLLPLLGTGCDSGERRSYPVHVLSDMDFGHLVHEGHAYKNGQTIETDILIVGGGISGMSAAWQLRGRNFLLCELSDILGGTSTAYPVNNQIFAQGAHYDLAYPENYGEEGIRMLSDMGIIELNTFSRLWEFKEKQYIIPVQQEGRCFVNGIYREDVLPPGDLREKFKRLLIPFGPDMVMPTRKINSDYHHLNDISFTHWLQEKLALDPSFLEGLHYNMRDDYGGDADTVSALAGIHYYTCRPYYTKPVELFSPPQGNYYFIEKMAGALPEKSIKTGHLVYKIRQQPKGFLAEVLDREKKERITIKTKKIIYAGNKHALKYVYPADYPLFQPINYAPWAIMTILVKDLPEGDIFWQNEIISAHPSLIGFVDSRSQVKSGSSPTVLTAYFCLDPVNRNILAEIEQQKEIFTSQVIRILSDYFNKDLKKIIERVLIRLLGHAMPVPVPGYLFKDKNDNRTNESMIYAGVDNHRLPLFFEALDSGILASRLIHE